MTTVKDLVAHLQRHFDPDDYIAAAIWQRDDVLAQAEGRGITITDDQADDIIERMDAKHDASIGISWDVIDVYLDMIGGTSCR